MVLVFNQPPRSTHLAIRPWVGAVSTGEDSGVNTDRLATCCAVY